MEVVNITGNLIHNHRHNFLIGVITVVFTNISTEMYWYIISISLLLFYHNFVYQWCSMKESSIAGTIIDSQCVSVYLGKTSLVIKCSLVSMVCVLPFINIIYYNQHKFLITHKMVSNKAGII